MRQAEAKPLAAHVHAAAAGHRAFLMDPAIERARRLQARALSGWAMDCLCLRRAGLHTPTSRRGTGELGTRTYRPRAAEHLPFAPSRVPRWTPMDTRAA